MMTTWSPAAIGGGPADTRVGSDAGFLAFFGLGIWISEFRIVTRPRWESWPNRGTASPVAHLAAGGQRDVGHHLEPGWHLVAGEAAAAEGENVVEAWSRTAVAELDLGMNHFA